MVCFTRRCSLLALVLMVPVAGRLYPTHPVANTIFIAGRSEAITWIDDTHRPLLSDTGLVKVDLYLADSDVLVRTLAEDVVADSRSVVVNVPSDLPFDFANYTLRFITASPPLTIYSADFVIAAEGVVGLGFSPGSKSSGSGSSSKSKTKEASPTGHAGTTSRESSSSSKSRSATTSHTTAHLGATGVGTLSRVLGSFGVTTLGLEASVDLGGTAGTRVREGSGSRTGYATATVTVVEEVNLASRTATRSGGGTPATRHTRATVTGEARTTTTASRPTGSTDRELESKPTVVEIIDGAAGITTTLGRGAQQTDAALGSLVGGYPIFVSRTAGVIEISVPPNPLAVSTQPDPGLDNQTVSLDESMLTLTIPLETGVVNGTETGSMETSVPSGEASTISPLKVSVTVTPDPVASLAATRSTSLSRSDGGAYGRRVPCIAGVFWSVVGVLVSLEWGG
ncbi:hypothetical protein CC2G_003330 [Coprinopsis cinerea AmutBmut pab1-1]|nr:hypothetical protein CC2G_003330 [Coprinopsis cinerea AmutBmut pab1-1]